MVLTAPIAANKRTSGPVERTRLAIKLFLKAGMIPV